MRHTYILGESDGITADDHEELYLSYLLENAQFKTNPSSGFSSFEILAGDSTITHSDVLKKPNPWHWMRANLDSVVELNVHGNR